VSFPQQLRPFPVLPVNFGPWHNKVHDEYMILFPGASMTLRQWPARKFASVADELHRQYGWQILLCGSAGEWELCQKVCEHMKAESLNLAGKTSLPQFAELTRGARLLIGNETSAVHIAVAVNTPTVCITGGGHYGRFVPYPSSFGSPLLMVANHKMACYSCNWQCIHPYQQNGAVPCIEKITTKDVLHLVAKLQERAIAENKN
jgi:ADP-heptose:LPS heptosyltransferase